MLFKAKKYAIIKIKMLKKKNLPEKICVFCKKPFKWRKKWERDWQEVKYCSKKCQKLAKIKSNS